MLKVTVTFPKPLETIKLFINHKMVLLDNYYLEREREKEREDICLICTLGLIPGLYKLELE